MMIIKDFKDHKYNVVVLKEYLEVSKVAYSNF